MGTGCGSYHYYGHVPDYGHVSRNAAGSADNNPACYACPHHADGAALHSDGPSSVCGSDPGSAGWKQHTEAARRATRKCDGRGRRYTRCGRGATIPLVVRNNTSEVVHGIEVHATAHGATGAIIASGSSQGFHPDTVQPGQITLGFAYFEQKGLPAGTTIEYQVTSEPGPDSGVMPSVDLPITQTNQAGGYVTGVAANPTGNPVQRARVDVTCFTPQGQLDGDARHLPASPTRSRHRARRRSRSDWAQAPVRCT